MAVPVRVVAVAGEDLGAEATVDQQGIERTVNLAMVPGVRPGDYLLVHAGFALRRLESAEAESIIADLSGMAGGTPA